MARTAPVPNMLAIPGMNPGLFVLAGGGDNGGSGAGGGKGGAGNQGAGGKNGGKDATGGGKGAGSCGSGSGGGCPAGHDGGGTTKGDPVDVATGRVMTVPAIDVRSLGRMGIEFRRSYSSASRERDIGIGFGWSHSYAWSIEVRRRTIEVWQEGGQRVVFPRPEIGQEVIGPLGFLLRAEQWGYVVRADDELERLFSEHVEDRILMTALVDRNNQKTTLVYEAGRLIEIRDPVNRALRIVNDEHGRIVSIESKNAEQRGRTIIHARYLYDEEGNLIRATDAEQADTRYEYDEDHRLCKTTSPLGLSFHFIYDAEGRCIETWGDRADGKDPSIAKDCSPYLADGRTLAKGILHNVIEHSVEGYCEVIDATRIQRFFFDDDGKITKATSGPSAFSRSYDALGLLTEYIDPAGNATQWKRDSRGLIVSYKDPLGLVTEYEHDSFGRVIRITNPEGGSVVVERDVRGNPLRITDPANKTTSYQYDDKGFVVSVTRTNGSAVRLKRDIYGNIVQVEAPNGGVYTLTYDYFGRQTSITGPTGAKTTTDYNDRGDITRVVSATGSISTFDYDAAGHPIAFSMPGGRTYKVGWGGLDQSTSLTRPDGTAIHLYYDYDQKLVCVQNEIGEEHRFEYDIAGFLSREKTYDGRTLSYLFDMNGGLIGYDNGAGEQTELVRDAVNQVIARKRADGSEETFEYNGRGEIVGAQNDRVEVIFERDSMGFVKRETQIVDGVSHSIAVTHDLLGERTSRTTSNGFVERFERDMMGGVARWTAPGENATFSRDLLGREVQRAMRFGGVLESAFDGQGRLSRRRAIGTRGGHVVGAGQPDWIGTNQGDVRMDRAYAWSAGDDLEQIWDQTSGLTRLEHDATGRVLGVLPQNLKKELYRYDAAERPHETGENAPSRHYGAGGRLLKRANATYTWDDAGRLVRKEVDFGPVAGTSVWTYSWNSADQLIFIIKPNGTVLEFLYDVFGRRVSKTEARRDLAGNDTMIATTRFVWDRQTLAEEIRTRHEGTENAVIEERTYCFEDNTFIPMAHYDARIVDGKREDLGVVHYVNDPHGTPTHLIAQDGSVAAELERTVWGVRVSAATAKGQSTQLRFQGQYEDEETGLYYNRHRYYDPETGMYISADPIGLAGGHRPFGYVRNPFVGVDPMGLGGKPGSQTTITTNDGSPPISTPSGSDFDPHPALPIPTTLPEGSTTIPTTRGKCSEVAALSALLDREGVPRDGTATKEQIDSAMKKIDKVETVRPRGNVPKKACDFCNKMMSDLGIPPEKIING